jgi:hypothetical protein
MRPTPPTTRIVAIDQQITIVMIEKKNERGHGPNDHVHVTHIDAVVDHGPGHGHGRRVIVVTTTTTMVMGMIEAVVVVPPVLGQSPGLVPEVKVVVARNATAIITINSSSIVTKPIDDRCRITTTGATVAVKKMPMHRSVPLAIDSI